MCTIPLSSSVTESSVSFCITVFRNKFEAVRTITDYFTAYARVCVCACVSRQRVCICTWVILSSQVFVHRQITTSQNDRREKWLLLSARNMPTPRACRIVSVRWRLHRPRLNNPKWDNDRLGRGKVK